MACEEIFSIEQEIEKLSLKRYDWTISTPGSPRLTLSPTSSIIPLIDSGKHSISMISNGQAWAKSSHSNANGRVSRGDPGGRIDTSHHFANNFFVSRCIEKFSA